MKGERCEAGGADCGPAAHMDADGMLLCRRCWDALEVETATQRRARELGLSVVHPTPEAKEGK